jgi:hypothetical protein
MGYLLPTEYVQYGLTAETTDDWVTMASALMEAHCRRPSLMVTQYVERMRLTAGSQALRLSYRPLAVAPGNSSALLGVRVRYGRPRRGETEDLFREQVAWAFGLPGSWSSLELGSVDLNMANGEVTFAQNLLGLNYNEAEVTYTAGFVTVPVSLKVACAQIVKNAQATPAANVRSSKMDTLQMEYFSSVLIDEQVQALLRPYVAERLG